MEILNILSDSLNGNTIRRIDHWADVLNELKEHAVFCLPYEAVTKSGCLTAEEMLAYQKLCYQNIAKNTQLLNEQKQLLVLFEENEIPVVILKGAAAAMYYPHPEYRVMGDIDIIVKPEDFEKTFRMLDQHYGCNQTLEINPRHAGFQSKGGIEIELHRYFAFGERNAKKDLLDQMIFDAIDRREWHEIRGYKIPCLPAIENGLVLLNHIYQHLQGGGIGYRQMLDFEEFVKKEKDHIAEFLEKAEQVGLAKLAGAMIQIYNRYLGLAIDMPGITIDESITAELLNIFVRSGNFGRKDNMDEGKRAEIVIQRAKNPITLLVTLQKFGRSHWKAAEKYAILRPFAWLYQIGYYIHQVRINGGLSVIRKGKKRISGKEKLFEQLGLLELQ